MSKIVTIDFETEAIEGDPLVNPPYPVGVAIKVDDHPSRYYGANAKRLGQYLKDYWYSDAELVFHNAPFDITVAVVWCGLTIPHWSRVHDTQFLIYLSDPHAPSLSLKPSAERILGMGTEDRDELHDWIMQNIPEATRKTAGAYISRAPYGLIEKYACMDTDMTYSLFTYLLPDVPRAAYDLERELQPYLTAATQKGIRIDLKALNASLANCEIAQVECTKRIQKILGAEIDIHNAGQLADALDKAGKVREWRYTPTGRRSTKRVNLIWGVNDPELLVLLSYASAMQTCLTTFMRPWSQLAKHTGRLHPSWNQVKNDDYGTRTGRLSCSAPNLQNVPNPFRAVVPEGLCLIPDLRHFLLPEKGQTWISRDFSSQEMRILAHYEDGTLMRAFQRDPDLDPHQMVSSLIQMTTGVVVKRKQVKGIGFGIMYGMGAKGLSKQLGLPVEEASDMMAAYHVALPGVKALQKGTKRRGRDRRPVTTIGGRQYFCEPPRPEGCTMRTFEYKLLNYLIQGSAADQTKRSLLRWFRDKPEHQTFLATVHDEINISMTEGDTDETLRSAMEEDYLLKLDVPMRTTRECGPNWGSLK